MIEVDCPTCFMPYRLKPELAGKKIRCRSCQGVIPVPRPGSERPQEPEEEWDETPLEEDLPTRPKKKRSGKKRRKRKETRQIKWAIVGIAAAVIFGILLMMGIAGFFFRPVWAIMVIMVWIVAAALSIVGGFGCMIAAFEEDALCGIMWLFIPFYSFYYIITRFSEIMIWVLMWLAGILMTFAAICLGGLLVGIEEGNFAGGGGGGGGIALLAPGNAQQSEDNVRAMGLASHNFHDVYNSFPPGAPEAGDQPMSWQTALLPFVDQNALYQQVDTTSAWNSPANQQPMGTLVPDYLQPSIGQTTSNGFALSHYALNQSFLMESGAGVHISDIRDGTSNTIMIGEVGSGYKPWGDPSNVRDPAAGLRPGPGTFGNPSGQGAYFVLSDGSVRFINADIDPQTLRGISTIDGGEVVGGF